MIGLREHIDEAQFPEGVSSFTEEAEVPGKGGGFARDINNYFWLQSCYEINDPLAACPRGIEDDLVRFPPFPVL